MRDHEVVETFISHLRDNGFPGLVIERRPELDKHVPFNMRIEAIAGPFAIEHTSIDTLPNQRGKSDWFMRATGGLEKELPIPPYRMNITIDYNSINKGQNWAAIREALKTWISKECPRLADGRHIFDNVPGIPFRLQVTKASDRPPRVFFTRYEPKDTSLPERISRQLDTKINKLAHYRECGFITVLLIESDDIALMNENKMFDAIRDAYPDGFPPSVGKIWYVDTSIPSEIEFRDFAEHLMK